VVQAGLDRVVQRPDQGADRVAQSIQVDRDVCGAGVEAAEVEVTELACLPGHQADLGARGGGYVLADVGGGVGLVHPVGEQQPGVSTRVGGLRRGAQQLPLPASGGEGGAHLGIGDVQRDVELPLLPAGIGADLAADELRSRGV
jgi:hypothetical protein